jgi:hypothetical protein
MFPGAAMDYTAKSGFRPDLAKSKTGKCESPQKYSAEPQQIISKKENVPQAYAIAPTTHKQHPERIKNRSSSPRKARIEKEDYRFG